MKLEKKIDVLGFGALNLDQIYQVDHIAGADDEAYIKNVTESCGGSAANTIIALAKLGLSTGYIAKIGADEEGSTLKNNLIQEKVDTSPVITSLEGRSGRVMDFIDPQGQRALYINPGVNDDIKFAEINLDYVNHTQILHLSSFVGDSFKTQKKVAEQLNEDVILSFDPGRLYVHKGIKALQKILKRTNLLLINEIELQILVEGRYDSYEQAAHTFIQDGMDVVVVKRGEDGVYAYNGIEEVDVEAYKVECVDSTGAGDTFNAGFIYGYLKQFSLEESCRLGNFIASKCIQQKGATTGLEDMDKILSQRNKY